MPSRRAHHPRIAILGAGLQGACVALALARRGYRTTLIERQAAPLLGASGRNEGKIHLGFVYALDGSGSTRRRMLESAMWFAPLLDELCGPLPWDAMCTEPFRYAVMPDSLAGPAALEASYAELDGILEWVVRSADRPLHYLGEMPGRLWRPARDGRGRPRVGGRPVEHVYETAEASVDPRMLARLVTDRLRSDGAIDLLCDTRVARAGRSEGGYRLELADATGVRELGADVVVNCTWEDRLRIDRSVGIEPDRDVCYRVKLQILVRPRRGTDDLAPVTMVQGPYGDLVPWPDGTVYVSWYPESRTYFGPEPPNGRPADSSGVARRSLEAMAKLFPDLAGARVLVSRPGTIIARGRTDVEDPASGLHQRDSFGPRRHDGWWTVDTGKLTAAPLNAERVASAIVRELGGGAA